MSECRSARIPKIDIETRAPFLTLSWNYVNLDGLFQAIEFLLTAYFLSYCGFITEI